MPLKSLVRKESYSQRRLWQLANLCVYPTVRKLVMTNEQAQKGHTKHANNR